MDFEAKAARKTGAVLDALPLRLRGRAASLGERIAPGAGMDLDDRRADRAAASI